MPKYNPNSIWTSKKEKIEYTPRGSSSGNWRPPSSLKDIEGSDYFPRGPKEEKSHIWWWAGGLFLVLVGLGILFFVYRPPMGPNVNITFAKPDQVLIGDPFQFSIALSNPSENTLKDGELTITLPDGISFVGESTGIRSKEEPVGDVNPGSVSKLNGDGKEGGFPELIATGGTDGANLAHLDIAFSYDTDTSPNTQFQTTGGADIYLEGPAVSLAVTPPPAVISGKDFDTVIKYTNNAAHDFGDVVLSLKYPQGFYFASSSVPASDAAHDSFDIGPVAAGGTGTFTVTGSVIGAENASYQLGANLAGTASGNTYQISQSSSSFAIAVSPLMLVITPNNDPNFVATPGNSIDYVLSYQNNSSTTFQNMAIKAALSGIMFDLSSVQSDGSFSSVNNTITWSPANTPALLSVAPGQSGSVNFSVAVKSSYPITRSYDKNFLLDVSGQISSPTVPAGTAASSTVSLAKAENKVGGKLVLAAKGFRNDLSDIVNTGPFPPKVNTATEYAIHWILTNYSTDMGNVMLTASLQSGTACTGTIKSNLPTAPVCDPGTGSVTWTIPMVPATMGITGAPAEAIFQVTNTPAVNQVGRAVTLMGPTTLSATDMFTSSTVNLTAPQITTALPDDTSVQGQGGSVVN